MKNMLFLLLAVVFSALPLTTNTAATTTENTGFTCNWKTWFEGINRNGEYRKGERVYVKVMAKKRQDIKYIELYVDGKSAGKEMNAPYEWGRGKGNKYLHYLKCGKHMLRIKIVDRCGKVHYEECPIKVICNGGHDRCVWECYFENIKPNVHYKKGEKLYVKVGAKQRKYVKYVELYVDGKSAGRENSYPYEWGRGKGNKILHYLGCGKHELKIKIVDICGDTHWEKCYIYIDCDGGHGGHDRCVWECYFENIKPNVHYKKGEKLYVKVGAKQRKYVKYVELYVDGKSAGRENSYPYEWGRGKGNKILHYLGCGKHELKIKIVDICGDTHWEKCYIYIDCDGGHGGHDRCVWECYFENIKPNVHYKKGEKLYVKVGAKQRKYVKYVELYVDGKSAGRENSYPYEWGRGKGNKILHYLKCGRHELKIKIVDICGDIHWEKCYIYIDCDNGHDRCVWDSWFETIKHNAHYRKGKKLYVKVGTKKPQHIKYMELFVDRKSAGKETSAPYEWGKGKGNNLLHRLGCGKHYLKVKIVDKCGDVHWKECVIYIDCK